jgi:hypothetical protein
MNTEEIVKLTPEAIGEVLRSRREGSACERRRSSRWPFPGTVEIHATDEDGPCFGSCRDISESGLGMRCDHYFEPESRISLSIHLPEATLYGEAVVRYCMQTPLGFMTGVEFVFTGNASRDL